MHASVEYYLLPNRLTNAACARREAMTRFLFVRMLFVAVLAAAGCAIAPESRELFVPAAKLDDLLQRRLSVDKNVLDVFRLRTGTPSVTLDPQAQRLRIDVDVSLGHPFSSRPLQGRAAISGGLAFDAATRTVLLTEPKVERLDIADVPAALREPVSRLATALGSELLATYPLVTLEPNQLTAFGQEYRVAYFDIMRDGLKVILRAKH